MAPGIVVPPHRMMRDIQAQPESLANVLQHQCGAGRGALEEAAAVVRGAQHILITGMGASLFAAMALNSHLQVRGLPSSVIEAGELLHFGGDLPRDSVVILVSRSGETVEAVRLLPKLRDAGAIIIGLTNEPGTTLAREADLPVLVNSGRDEAVAVQSYTGTVMTTLLLGAAVAGQDRRQEAAEAVDAVRALIQECLAQPHAEALQDARVVYVLGRGPALGSAQEGALLFHETAKLPAVAMPAGGFRHGPVEAVDANFRAYLFASEPRTFELDEALRSYIVQMGGQVQMIAVTPGFFAPVVEIVPLQFAAYAAAGQRGITPGLFRYVSLVTTSETAFQTDAS